MLRRMYYLRSTPLISTIFTMGHQMEILRRVLTTTFKHRHCTKDIDLSNCLWKLHDDGIGYQILWKTALCSSPYRFRLRRCDFSLTEMSLIAHEEPNVLLNKR